MRRLTSGGTDIGAIPIRDGRDDEVENCLIAILPNAGTRKPEISLVGCASRRRHLSGCRNPVQAIMAAASSRGRRNMLRRRGLEQGVG